MKMWDEFKELNRAGQQPLDVKHEGNRFWYNQNLDEGYKNYVWKRVQFQLKNPIVSWFLNKIGLL